MIILAIFMELSTSLSYLLLPKSNTHDLFPGLGRESKKPLIIFQLLCFDDVTIDFTQSKFVTAWSCLRHFTLIYLDLKIKRSFRYLFVKPARKSSEVRAFEILVSKSHICKITLTKLNSDQISCPYHTYYRFQLSSVKDHRQKTFVTLSGLWLSRGW